VHPVTRRNLLPAVVLLLATAGAAADGGQQSELVVYAGGRLGAGVAWLDALLVLVAVVGATGAGLGFGRRWPDVLVVTAPVDIALFVAALDPPADLRLALVVAATAVRILSLLAVLAGAQDVGLPALAGFAVGGYVLGGYLPGAHWLLGVGAVGGLLAAAVRRPAASRPTPAPRGNSEFSEAAGLASGSTSVRSTVDLRALAIGVIAAALSLLPLLLQGISAQETLGVTGFAFAAAALVLGSLFGWRSLAWLVATTLVVLGIGLPTGVGWPLAILGVVAGCALSFLPFRAFIAAGLCVIAAFVGGFVVFAALAGVAASALPALRDRRSTPVVFGPLLAVAVTAGAELILWSTVTFGGQEGGVLFGDGHVTIPLLCTAAVLAGALGVVDARTINS
jgi:prepilin-type processing-associated H-X9-DG protein